MFPRWWKDQRGPCCTDFCLQCPRSAGKIELQGAEKDVCPPRQHCSHHSPHAVPVPASAARPHRAVTSQLSLHPLVLCGGKHVLVPLTAARRRQGHPGTPVPGPNQPLAAPHFGHMEQIAPSQEIWGSGQFPNK